MKQVSISIITFFLLHTSFAQDTLVPKRYQAIKEIFGDLDKDEVDERVVVYNMNNNDDETEGTDREVIIFKKKFDKWTIWHRSRNAVGNSRDGGMMGDPFEDIEIKGGILLISESGGSSWKWDHKDKYRYQNNVFELIGYTSNYGKPCEYWENLDFNLMTEKIVLERKYEKCDNQGQVVYKTQKENFAFKLKNKITLDNRRKNEVKLVSPKYRHELYL